MTKRWYVNKLSKMTGVSVRTLHHYDNLDLLKPSVRLENGYRLYTEEDLLKLQQIIALKFFGFNLSQIKSFLDSNMDIMNHLLIQAKLLEEKAHLFLESSQLLKNIAVDGSNNTSIPWEKTIQLIEVYRMKQQLEKTWAGKAFNAEELKEYAQFQTKLEKKPESERINAEQSWANLCQQIRENLSQDPASEESMALARRCKDWVNNLYGKEYIDLSHAVWQKGFKGGHIEEQEHGMSPQMISWLDKAMEAYYRNWSYSIFSNIGTPNEKNVSQLLQELIDHMCGDSLEMKTMLFQKIMENPDVRESTKQWLKDHKMIS